MQYVSLAPDVVEPHSAATLAKTEATVERVADVDDLKYSVILAAAPEVAAVCAWAARERQEARAGGHESRLAKSPLVRFSKDLGAAAPSSAS